MTTGEGVIVLRVAPDIPAEPPEWTFAAVCQSVDPEIFFPEKGGSTREAKRVCAACPVKQECLDDALDRDDAFGIYGGMSVRERRKLRPAGRSRGSRRPVAACGTTGGYNAHRRRDEPTCAACREANRIYQQEYARIRKSRRSA